MQTNLDKAIDNARKNPDKGDEYINLFLNGEIFIPVWDDPEDSEGGEQVEIRPVTANNEDGDFIMAFDTRERLESWMDVARGVTSLQGFTLLSMVKDQPVQICVNAGTQYMKVFTRDEITWLLENSTVAQNPDEPSE